MSTMPHKLIVGDPTYELVVEKNANEPNILTIAGPYLMAEQKNRNGRIYRRDEMLAEVARYQKDFIDTKRAMGELNHPPSAEVNPERVCHRTTQLVEDGKYFMGKSRILNTPLGTIVRNLILDDCQLGVSSRALGQVTKTESGDLVNGFRFICVDVVTDPSVDKAFVNGILESKQWILDERGHLEPLFDKLERDLKVIPRHNPRAFMRTLALKFIEELK